MSKIILYIATSQDGYIADKNGGVDWLPQPKNESELEAFGYKALMDRIDTIIMGRKSYEQILSFGNWAWTDKQTYVFTSQMLPIPHPSIHHIYKASDEWRAKHLSKKDIWLLGGAELARTFADKKMIDEIILTIAPIQLEEGIKLCLPLKDFALQSSKDCLDNLKQLTYARKQT